MAPVAQALAELQRTLQDSLATLRANDMQELKGTLHNYQTLPHKELAAQASETVDLLHSIEQLLTPGSLILADHFLGFVCSKCLSAAVELGVPDALKNGPLALKTLAETCKANTKRLGQILRVLYNNGIFVYDSAKDQVSNNHVSELLLSDHWTQWHNWVELYGSEFYDMARGISRAVRADTTRMPAQIEYNTDDSIFSYFEQQGWVPRLHRTLGGGANAQAPGILEDYPWPDDGTFLDIGGGVGSLVAQVLRRYPRLRAGILDLPKVISLAESSFHGEEGQFADVGDRVDSLIAGDFLIEVPSFEVYTMKWCLHDWDDSKALKVLKNVRRSIARGPNSRLVIFESLLADGRMGRLSRYGDMIMWISANGEERTERQWKDLAEQTGWTLRKIYPLRNAWPSAIEFVPDWTKNMSNLGFNAQGNDKIEDPEHVPSVSTNMRFLEPWDTLSQGNPFIRSSPSPGYQYMNFAWQDSPVHISDARPHRDAFALDKQGFAFYDEPKGADPFIVEAIRNNNKDDVQTKYFPCVEELVKRMTGAKRVIIFDYTLRRRNPAKNKSENDTGREQPATMVHCDQSANGALRRLQQNIGKDESISETLKRRVQMINIWRPLNGPVQDWPLAVMDYRSLTPDNVHSTDLWKGEYELRGQTVSVSNNAEQRWWYLDGHRSDEVTAIKIWDNNLQKGNAKFCPHSAFEHPGTPIDAPPRESIEVRCIAIHD